MQTKRNSYLALLAPDDVQKLMEHLKQNPDALVCYCGGKFLEVCDKYAQRSGETPERTDGASAEFRLEVESKTVDALRNEVQELIQLSESRRVDRVAISRQLLDSEFFRDIWEQNRLNMKYIEELEAKIVEQSRNAQDIAIYRTRELGEIKERHF